MIIQIFMLLHHWCRHGIGPGGQLSMKLDPFGYAKDDWIVLSQPNHRSYTQAYTVEGIDGEMASFNWGQPDRTRRIHPPKKPSTCPHILQTKIRCWCKHEYYQNKTILMQLYGIFQLRRALNFTNTQDISTCYQRNYQYRVFDSTYNGNYMHSWFNLWT